MSATSESLKKPAKIVTDTANELVKSYLKSIDAAIQSHPKRLGKNVVLYDLPTFFPLDGLDKKSGQALIYALIMNNLEERKITVKIVLRPDKTILVVQFETTPDSVEISGMANFVKDHVISDADLEKLIKGK